MEDPLLKSKAYLMLLWLGSFGLVGLGLHYCLGQGWSCLFEPDHDEFGQLHDMVACNHIELTGPLLLLASLPNLSS